MRQKNPDICNKALVALNVIVFFILELLGDTEDAIFMYEHGAGDRAVVSPVYLYVSPFWDTPSGE